MKRITSLLLLFTLLTVLAACGGVDPDNLPWDRYLADYGRIRAIPEGIDSVIATKGDLVICVVSKGEIFTAFGDILKEAGWSEAEILKNDSAG